MAIAKLGGSVAGVGLSAGAEARATAKAKAAAPAKSAEQTDAKTVSSAGLSAGVAATPEKARVDADTVRGARTRFANMIPQGLLPSSRDVAGPLMLSPDAVEKLKRTATEQVEHVAKEVEGGTRGNPSADELASMKPGDKITVGTNSDVNGKIYRVVDGTGDFELKKTIEKNSDGTYKVTLEQGGKLGAGVGDDVSISARRGGKIVNEYEAKTPEEAAKLMQDVGTPQLSNPTPGLAEEEMAKQAESMKRVNDARRSTEVSLEDSFQADAQIDAPMGPGMKVDGKVKSSQSMKVDYDENGRPTKVTIKLQQEIEANGMPRIGANGGGGGVTISPEQGSKTKVTVSREITVDLPADFDATRLATDPAGVVRELKSKTAMQPNKVEIEQTLGNVEKKITLEGQKGRDVNVPQLLTDMGTSDPLVAQKSPTDALRDAGVQNVKVETWEKQGIDFKVGIDVGVGGVEVGYERMTRVKQPDVNIPLAVRDAARA
jgi:hypothetical protein